MRFALACSLTALLVGCAASSSDNSASNSAAATAPAADADYLVFQTRADADAWYQANKADLMGPDAPAMLPATDARVVRIQGIIDSLWPTVQQKFNVGMRSPFPMIIDDTTVNAFAMYDPSAKAIPDVIFVFGGILSMSDEDLTGVLAHEMGHMITKNAIPAYQRAMTKFYNAGPNEQLGINAANDPDVQTFVQPYIDGAQIAGQLDFAELHGLPLAGGALGQFFGDYAKQHISTSAECTTFRAAMKQVGADLQAGATDDGVTLSASQLTTLDTDVLAAQAASIPCLKPAANQDIAGALTQNFGQPITLDMLGLSPEQAQETVGKDAVTGLLDVLVDLRAQMRPVTASPAFPTTRNYTMEEQADDFSMTILFAQGKDPWIMGRGVENLGGPEAAARCEATLAAGKVPAYGIDDPHHTDCYRAFHSRAFKTYLQGGGVGVTPVHAPLMMFDRFGFDPIRDRILID
jgi:hypothetical protein